MIEVLGRRNSANVQKVMWALGELNLEYERRDVGGSFGYPDDYATLNPNVVVPTIRDGDLTVWESNACVRYLARTYGHGSLWPNEGNAIATADQWMDWQGNILARAFTPLLMNMVRIAPADRDPAKIDAALAECASAWGQLEEGLTGKAFIAGSALTMGDVALGSMTYRYLALDIDRPPLPNVTAWYERLASRPAFSYHVMIPFGTNAQEWAEAERKNAGLQ